MTNTKNNNKNTTPNDVLVYIVYETGLGEKDKEIRLV